LLIVNDFLDKLIYFLSINIFSKKKYRYSL